MNGLYNWFIDRSAHLAPARGTAQQNRDYCTKEEGRLDGPWEFGVMPEQGKRNDLLAMKADLDQGASMKYIAENHFSNFIRYSKGIKEYKMLVHQHTDQAKTVKCYWGSTGVGKTKLCYERYPGAYWKTRSVGQSQWWDGYDGQDTIVIDEFYGWFPWDFLLRLTDRYPLSLEVKCGTVPCAATTIIFTSNKHPQYWYPNIRYNWDHNNPLFRRFGGEVHQLGGEAQLTFNVALGMPDPRVVPRPAANPDPTPRFKSGIPVDNEIRLVEEEM